MSSSKESEASQPPNVYIVGAQCTGKTSLTDALTEHFRSSANRSWAGRTIPEPLIVKEVARNALTTHNFTAADITSSPARALALQKLILEAQYQAEEAVAGNWYISDRSAIDPIIYAKVFAGEEAAADMMRTEAWTQLREKMRAALVFVCAPNPAWLQGDKVRLMPKDWEEWINLHRAFRDSLQSQQIHFEVLTEELNTAERANLIVQRLVQLDSAPRGELLGNALL